MHLKLALDWTPNTLHAGMLIGQAKRYYQDAGLDLEIINPADNDYQVTPAKKLAQKHVHLAIAPSESAISFRVRKDPTPLVAVAANLQQDTSAIVTLKDSGISRPADMDGRKFASYNARFENDIVRQMVINDGGKGTLDITNPAMLTMWDNLVEKYADATWVFLPWEGVKAKHEHNNLQYHAFQMGDFGVPYGYSPLILSHQDFIDEENEAIAVFLKATEQGWRDVYTDPEAAAQVLHEHVDQPEFRNLDFVISSLKMIKPALLTTEGRWGGMQDQRWIAFVDWLTEKQIIKDEKGVAMHSDQIDVAALYTNHFFS